MNELIKVTEKNGEQFKYCSFLLKNMLLLLTKKSNKKTIKNKDLEVNF